MMGYKGVRINEEESFEKSLDNLKRKIFLKNHAYLDSIKVSFQKFQSLL